MEVALPVMLRKANDFNANGGFHGKKKRVGFDDQLDGSKEEREFLDSVRHQVALPDYTIFGDYNEMATQVFNHEIKEALLCLVLIDLVWLCCNVVNNMASCTL